ncbi:MAG: BamA/TamA family outer membrane protein [Fimbriimonadaceae bacterium]|nr:BamA/TamA family outer membrane protein [Chitinophagales bacterium]
MRSGIQFIFYSIYFLFILCFPYNSFSQIIDSTATDTTSKKRIIFAPIIAYQPETSWAFGAGAVYYFKPGNHYISNTAGYSTDSLMLLSTNPSQLKAIAVYTLENQFQFELGGDVYTIDNNYFLSFNFAYFRYPASFFGIGNNTLAENQERYTNTHPYIRFNAQKKIINNFYAGAKLFFEHTKISGIDSGKILDTENIIGEEGGLNTGIGPWIKYDTRNNINYPSKGIQIDVSSVFHEKFLGSDYTYIDNTLEISYFLNTFKTQVIAFNAYSKFQKGSPPFNRMAELGGSYYMRGNYEGRFRDKNYITLQTEYRIPLGNFFAIHFFGGVGEVANEFSAFTMDGLKYSFGAGGRFFLIPEDKLSLRIDYAFGSKSDYDPAKGIIHDRGLYVTIGEAF